MPRKNGIRTDLYVRKADTELAIYNVARDYSMTLRLQKYRLAREYAGFHYLYCTGSGNARIVFVANKRRTSHSA